MINWNTRDKLECYAKFGSIFILTYTYLHLPINFDEVVKLLPSQAPILLEVDSIMPEERFNLTLNKAVSHSLLT